MSCHKKIVVPTKKTGGLKIIIHPTCQPTVTCQCPQPSEPPPPGNGGGAPTPLGFLSRSNVGGLLNIGVNEPVSFNTPGVQVGDDIVVLNDTTFSIQRPGFYVVQFYLYTVAATLLGTVKVQFSGTAAPNPNDVPFSLLLAGVNLSGAVAFEAKTPGALQLVQTGLGLSLSTSGTNAVILIRRIA
ncbi:hypothetical protein AB1399_05470 [Hydrogenibacillus schlegelii]|uniref:BclA C-terminal domain-containing protein n=1 Tax=Hydrogenibacillus schlegelii TaxID=1484 RepID=A0A132NA56_HYDSH|nr:hypothetical protein [Hydrogenibacillus schlegelii]KWX06983.1 hypothetical protein TR75_04310 [Hydrogenibacillus schlegelii]OAR03304.1 hypothetical protein SA87_03875 [Hydrogenibacillus schlegelii]